MSSPYTDGRPSLDIPSVSSRPSVSSQTSVSIASASRRASVNSLARKDAGSDSDYELEDYVMLASQVSALPLMQDQTYKQDIFLYPPNGREFASAENRTRSLHVVCLDPQCTYGNWISKVLVAELGMENEIKPIRHSPQIRDYHGKRVIADGVISFKWKHRECRSLYWTRLSRLHGHAFWKTVHI